MVTLFNENDTAAGEPENPKLTRAPRTRATIDRERTAIETAVAEIVGPHEATHLIELGETIRVTEHRPDDTPSATERAMHLLDTPEGRAKLAAMTWETV